MMFIYTLPLLVKYRAIMVIDILPLLEKESGHGQRPPSSSGKGGGVIMFTYTLPLLVKHRATMVIEILLLLEERREWP